MPKRPNVPEKIGAEILFAADHTCCICREKRKDVQIHHIDGNNKNNSLTNLAVLCLDCHSVVTGRRGLGRSYTPREVRKYKLSWEKQTRLSRGVHQPSTTNTSNIEDHVEIIICDILSRPDGSPRTKELLDLLYELHLWKGDPKLDQRIIDGLSHLSLMSGVLSPKLAASVAEMVWQMCWHFVDPKDIPIDKDDAALIVGSIDSLRTLALFNCRHGHGRKTIDVISEHNQYFFELGITYSKKRIVDHSIDVYRTGVESCYEDGKLAFSYGRTSLRRSIRSSLEVMKTSKPTWNKQLEDLEKLLTI